MNLAEWFNERGIFGPDEQLVELDRLLKEEYSRRRVAVAAVHEESARRLRCRTQNHLYWARRAKVAA